MLRKSMNLILAASALLISAGCAGGQAPQNAQGGASQAATSQASTPQTSESQTSTPQPATPARVSAADLSKLRWIEGTWRGTGDVEAPFFERYRFENDSTLAVDGFEDETVGKVTEMTRFELKGGEFGGGGEGSRWAASELTDDSVTFIPVRGARNSFRWQKESDGTWKAVLDWPASNDKPARRRVYKMERWPAAKKEQ
jgi:hypothetical protein